MHTTTLIAIYLLGAVATALAAFAESRFWREAGSAPQDLSGVAMLTGALWPILLLGVVQFGVVFTLQRFARRFFPAETPVPAVDDRFSDEFDGAVANMDWSQWSGDVGLGIQLR